ncbi:hypothetical protein [Streptomyces sp. ITFR-16]|uniref:hypothetical protein n=1 Tax=Streptomyces sp. ITFR-16 TaxID=3075198 RepID=UPI00288A99FE|nr:hypothetical protein [Streptomyces sp. ITFR-16]WNI24574.1 hypothetical protein RLT58_22930 [Streptomyces sp. ITFR-16]
MTDASVLGHRDDVTAVRDKEHANTALTWALDESEQPEPYRVRADGPWGSCERRGHDLVAALDSVRRELERDGWLLAVNAARPDVSQSGMLRSSGSSRAYLLRPGKPAGLDAMVDLFDDAPPTAVTSVEAQHEAHERWARSL